MDRAHGPFLQSLSRVPCCAVLRCVVWWKSLSHSCKSIQNEFITHYAILYNVYTIYCTQRTHKLLTHDTPTEAHLPTFNFLCTIAMVKFHLMEKNILIFDFLCTAFSWFHVCTIVHVWSSIFWGEINKKMHIMQHNSR